MKEEMVFNGKYKAWVLMVKDDRQRVFNEDFH